MIERWSWTYADGDGASMTGPPTSDTAFPTQGDAESWFGEVWRDLADAGVASVTLLRNGAVVYGPMSLDPAP
ncbi:MAG: hypothetical protein ACRCYX_02100 [Dermatophilaceae bacterium]